MEKLSGESVASCKRNGGRILRGDATTRLETFVDTAFAFAFTMLVISIDQIPRSPEELIQLSKDIPSFVLSALPIGSVWIAHSSWSSELVWVIFLYVAIGLIFLSLILIAFYQNTLKFGQELSITEEETKHCITFSLIWGVVAGTAVFSMLIASIVSPENIQLAGYIYFSLFFTTVVVPIKYSKYRPLTPA